MSRRARGLAAVPLACAALLLAAAPRAGELSYDIAVRLDPDARWLEASARITVEASRETVLELASRFEVTRALADGEPFGAAALERGASRVWRLAPRAGAPRRIEFAWRGRLAPLDRAADHRRALLAEEPASGPEGAFLPDAGAWYPRPAGSLLRYRLSLELPPGRRGLVPGRLIEEKDSAAGYRARFAFEHPAAGIDLMAGPYRIESDTMTGAGGRTIRLRTYFHPEIAHLARGYLESVREYLQLYESWIGPYAFTEFSVVSSPTPTGFGLPTIAYLGTEVLRLPFIRGTSLGHEVLHNWWGNGVYPDYARGNWAEGLTTFLADYAYREREGEEAARAMRVAWLRDLAALAPAQDVPLAAFTSRTHAASSILGYNKAAMVFLMLRERIGRESFERALRAFWNEQRFRVASWAELRRVFERESGEDLDALFEQWLERAGVPALRLARASSQPSAGGFRVTVALQQGEPPYRLRVPLVLRTVSGETRHTVALRERHGRFAFEVPERPLEVVLDPDFRLLRRLAPQEAPPILRQAMVHADTLAVLLPAAGEARGAAARLAARLLEHPPKLLGPEQRFGAAPLLVIGLEAEVDAWLARRGLPARPEPVRGRGSAQAWAAARADGGTVAVVSARDAASLAALARRLPHYGGASYVMFEGERASVHGVWPGRPQSVRLD